MLQGHDATVEKESIVPSCGCPKPATVQYRSTRHLRLRRLGSSLFARAPLLLPQHKPCDEGYQCITDSSLARSPKLANTDKATDHVLTMKRFLVFLHS